MLHKIFPSLQTVDTLTSSFTSLTDKLKRHAETQQKRAAKKESKIYDLTAQRRHHENEAGRALAVAAKIEGFISTP